MGKRGPKPLTAQQATARGSREAKQRAAKRAREEAAGTRPAVWDRDPAPESAVLPFGDAISALAEWSGCDPRETPGEWVVDEDAGLAAVRWFHAHLTHVEGRWARTPLVLSPLQQGILCAVFGFRRPDGTRRFRKVLIYVPRKWGKSIFAAGLCLYLLDCDDKAAAQVYCAAAARHQAANVWRPARFMVLADEHLSQRFRVFRTSIARMEHGEEDGGFFKTISADADTAHGYNPVAYVVDELHTQPNGELVDALETAVGAQHEPLQVFITTADYERESICNEIRDYAVKVRDGVIDDPAFLPVVLEASQEDDWESEEVWARVNPHYPETPNRDFMRAEAQKARATPRFLNTFRRLHLNMRTSSDVAWFDMDLWDACTGPAYTMKDLRGVPAFAALDLSAVSDLTCLLFLFPTLGNYVLPFFWVPRDTALRRDERHILPSYLAWARAGAMHLCPGGWIDQNMIRDKVLEMAEIVDIRRIAVDRWQAAKIVTELGEDHGLPVVLFGQGYASMSAPSKELERLVLSGRLNHGGHPVLRWNAANTMVMVDESPAENIKPAKVAAKGKARKADDNKIDGVVSLVMALGVAMAEPTEVELDEIYAEGSDLGISV